MPNFQSELMNKDLHPLDLEDDRDDIGDKLSTPGSIMSFWIAGSGLAVLAILVSVAAFFASKLDESFALLFAGPYGQLPWTICQGIHTVIGAALIPCIVLGSLVPVLYWRGGLLQRFGISVALAVTVMNLTIGEMGAWGTKVPVWQVVAILMCWAAMPVIFKWTPIRTRSLRLIVVSCLLVLTLCLSILHMFQSPQNINLLYWESVYGAAFGYALIRRNWGRVAFLEAGATIDQVERTSSRTLLELMAVCGLACAASMYWSTFFNLGVFIQLVQAAALGVCTIVASMACIRVVLHKSAMGILRLFGIGLLMFLLICASSMVDFALYDPWGIGNWRNLSFILAANEVPAAMAIASFAAAMVYVVFMLLVGLWLKCCGWRTQDQVFTETLRE